MPKKKEVIADKEEITEESEQLREKVEYYAQNYRGIYAPEDFPNVYNAEICSLLFAILAELRELNTRLQEE